MIFTAGNNKFIEALRLILNLLAVVKSEDVV